MLSDRLRQLLTGYVDGELTARQRRAVQRLLQRSAEARTLVQRLKQDAGTLRALPRQTPPSDLVPRVLRTISDLGLRPARRSRPATPARVPSWFGLAAAAAVLLLISSASFVYFTFVFPGTALTARSTSNGDALPVDPAALVRVETPRDDGPPAPAAELLPFPTSEHVAQATPSTPTPESPSESTPPDGGLENILAVPTPKMELFPQIADPKLALILSLAEINQTRPARELTDELSADLAFRIELACLESSKALDWLRAAFQAQGIRLVIDPVAQDRLKRKLPTNYALYVENLSRDEVARVLRRLAAEDAKAKPRRQFDKLILQRMTAGDFLEVAKLLGVDVKTLDTPRPRSPRDMDLQQPLSKSTADDVERALLSPSSRPTPSKPGERLAVVVPYNPVRPRPTSPPVKQFLDQRKERQPDAVQLVLVLRGSKG